MQTAELTWPERVFRLWMRISFWMYVAGAAIFLLAGAYIPPVINAISAKLLPLPLYPLPVSHAEGAFWRVLGVSMMVMLAWICGAVYRDIRGNGRTVPILLVSKFCSTAVYFLLFVTHGYLAYLVGALTDGPIFAITLALWFQALPADRYISPKEEGILVALGDALMPRGGAFRVGYLDLRDACVADARGMCAAENAVTLLSVRLILRILDWAPALMTLRPRTFSGMPQGERAAFLVRLEASRDPLKGMLVLVAKLFVLLPFFNQPDAAQAVGYSPESRIEP
jgi:hypothetical protein